MAFRYQVEPPRKALPGQMLLVVHDFEARSPDELSLTKGDRIELIERDDDFGDGWFLGKHLQNKMTGLFPEVYTTPAPKGGIIPAGAGLAANPRGLANIRTNPLPQVPIHEMTEQSLVSPVSPEDATPQPSWNTGATKYFASSSATPPPLNATPPLHSVGSADPSTASISVPSVPSTAQRSLSRTLSSQHAHGEDSPVMNETLSVIDEHITDMNTPRSSLIAGDRRGPNESGSDYSSHVDHRLSYITGNETDEEEHSAYTEAEVINWTPARVAEYLRDIGVESRHCEVFLEQEISGEVLLGMDQTSIFMKEFDLGLVGRRLRTWHRIKALQEEVKAQKQLRRQAPDYSARDGSSEDYERTHSMSGTMLPRIPSLMERQGSKQDIRQSRQHTLQPRSQTPEMPKSPSHPPPPPPRTDTRSPPTTFSFTSGHDSPSRPSAASVRELNHSRRHSSIDFNIGPLANHSIERSATASPNKASGTTHKKQPSFDRHWTMSGAMPTANGRPTSSVEIGGHSLSLSSDRNTFEPSFRDSSYTSSTPQDVDRGYFSGGEIDGRRTRNVLKKRDSTGAGHSRQSSCIEEQRRRSTTGSKRHSRFGSADSIRETVAAVTSPAAKMYYGSTIRNRFRNSSVNESESSIMAPKDSPSPTVTRLGYDQKSGNNPTTPLPKPESLPSNGTDSSLPSLQTQKSAKKPRIMGLRAISDAVTGSEKALVVSPASLPSPIKESPLQSPTRTGSSTPSGASKSFELESTDASSKGANGNAGNVFSTSGTTRRKSKKDTSAYTRGLEKKSPQEQMVGCDYSGWMKKKSSNLMTTWKPRLFVLRGRRLSYYYSENDDQEK
ncbi:MAG: polar growth protein, partial [Pleopsidium flavum]